MHASPLLRTLQLLTQEELETLHLFVASPIFNDTRPDETLALFEYLKKYYPAFDDRALHRDAAGAHFFPRAANPVGALQRTMTQLMAIVRKFVTFRYTMLRDAHAAEGAELLHDIQQQIALMRFYGERMRHQPSPPATSTNEAGRKGRRAENFFENLNNQARRTLDNCLDFSHFDEYGFADFHNFRYMVEQEKAFFEQWSSERGGDKNLLAATEHFDSYYLLTKLDQMCRLVHYQRMSELYEAGTPEHTRFLANRDTTLHIVRALRANGFLQQPAIALYCTLLDFLTQDDPAEADRLSDEFEKMLEENPRALPLVRQRALRVMLRSFWPARYRETKDRRFLERLFSQQLQQIQQLTPTEPLPSTHFQNILLTALKLGKADWAAEFYAARSTQISGLADEPRALLLDILQASIRFAQRDFAAAAKTLPHYLAYGALADIYLYAIAATLDVRIRYELDTLDEDYAERMMHATTTRLRRDDTLPPKRLSERLRFFPLAKDLSKLRLQRQQNRRADLSAGLAKIRQRIDSETVVDWEWLEEKYTEQAKG
jgi:hypothetical protein